MLDKFKKYEISSGEASKVIGGGTRYCMDCGTSSPFPGCRLCVEDGYTFYVCDC